MSSLRKKSDDALLFKKIRQFLQIEGYILPTTKATLKAFEEKHKIDERPQPETPDIEALLKRYPEKVLE